MTWSRRNRLQLRPLEISRPEEATRQSLANGVPPAPAQLARECGTEPAAYLSEAPVMSAYALEDGTVYLTYSTTARGWSS